MSAALDDGMIDWTGDGPADQGASTAAREFTASDGCYALSLPGIVLEVDRLRRDRGVLSGELIVRCTLPGARPVDDHGTISAAEFSLSGQRARQERATVLSKRSGNDAIDWYGLLEELCLRVIQAERTGEPGVYLRDVPPPAPDRVVEIIPGFPLPLDDPALLFADGGSLKSLIALYTGGKLEAHGIRAGFFDWEWTASQHRGRFEHLFGPEMPGLFYVRCERPLTEEADRLRRIIRDERIAFGIFDSVAFACDGPPEAAETASAYFRALRSLRIGSLNLAHITKSEGGDQRPFGSIFWHNHARATWYIKRATDGPDTRAVDVALFNRKANTGALRPVLGLEVVFDNGRIEIHRKDAALMEDVKAKLPTWHRMIAALRSGPLTQAALASELEVSGETIRKAVQRSRTTFTRIEGSDGITRIALAERAGR
jgi:hypothetical protein